MMGAGSAEGVSFPLAFIVVERRKRGVLHALIRVPAPV